MTTARGCTKPEAAVAAAKLRKLEATEQKAVEILTELGWSDHAAKGITSCLSLPAIWHGCIKDQFRGALLPTWAARKQRDPMELETQLRFLTEDLRTTMMRLGSKIAQATSADAAAEMFKPLAAKLSGETK